MVGAEEGATSARTNLSTQQALAPLMDPRHAKRYAHGLSSATQRLALLQSYDFEKLVREASGADIATLKRVFSSMQAAGIIRAGRVKPEDLDVSGDERRSWFEGCRILTKDIRSDGSR